MADMAETESVLRDVMDRWKTAVDAHEPERVAAVFTQDAIFQGTSPFSVGRQGAAAYYAAQPLGMKARYQILEVRRLSDDVALGYLDVEFAYVDEPSLPVHLGVVIKRETGTWHICHYQVTRGV
jgi:uncharacterized protein (TIGR02246 family)